MGTIAVVGSINQDLNLRLDSLPHPGETVLAHTMTEQAGGKGANQAVAIARSGASPYLIGAVGDDQTGDLLLRSLRSAGVDADHVVKIRKAPTGMAVVMVDTTGQNSIVVASGANMELTDDHVIRELSLLEDVSVVLTQAELSPACLRATAEFAHIHGSRLVLNLAPFRPIDDFTLGICDPLVVNEVEAAALGKSLGQAVDDLTDLTRQLARVARSVIITLGGDGALYGEGNHVGHVKAPHVEVIDTTGAGDAFVGAMVACLTEGKDLAVACRAGVDAGSQAVQYRGAQP